MGHASGAPAGTVYNGAFRLADAPSDICDDGVYFGTVSEYLERKPKGTKAAFILYADKPLSKTPGGQLVGIFDNAEKHQAAYLATLGLFMEDSRMRRRVDNLVDQVSAGTGLETIANLIAEICQAPVSITDNAYTLIVSSDDYENQSIPLDKHSRNDHIPETIKALLKQRGTYLPTVKDTDATLISWEDKAGAARNAYLTLIHIKGVPIASFCVFPHEPLPPYVVKSLPQIASIISTELQKSDFYLANKSARFASLLSRLIDNPLHQDINSLIENLELLGHSLKHYKYVVYVDLNNEFLNVSQTRALAEELRHCIANSIYVVRDGNIIFLTSRSSNAALSEDELSSWHEIAQIHNIKIGISSQFKDLLMTKTYLMQAQMAIRTGKVFDSSLAVYPFDNYRMADLIASIDDREILFSFRYPPLMRLVKNDLDNDTHLAYTVFCYLKDPSDPSRACEELFIHKNTLYYRLNKARSIMGIEFKSADEIMQLQFTFLLLQYQGKFDQLIPKG